MLRGSKKHPDAEQPDVEERHRGEIEARTAEDSEEGLRDGDGLLNIGHAEQLDRLTGMALDRAEDILKKPISPKQKNYARLQATQAGVIADILRTTVRVDENRLRARKNDGMKKILDAIRKAEKKGVNAKDVTPLPSS